MTLIVATSPAHAGWVKDWCAKHLVAEDPWPMFDYPTDYLLRLYKTNRSEHTLKELAFRVRRDVRITEAELAEFWRIVDDMRLEAESQNLKRQKVE